VVWEEEDALFLFFNLFIYLTSGTRFLLHHHVAMSSCLVGPTVSFGVNLLLISDLLELQKNCRKVVDFGFQNVKWYHLVHLSTKVVVLCYSLHQQQKLQAPRKSHWSFHRLGQLHKAAHCTPASLYPLA
jgi:hypothetical protein